MTDLEVVALASFLFCVAFTVLQSGVISLLKGKRYAEDGLGQSVRDIVLEAWANIVIGFSFNYAANPFILPLVPSLGYNDITAWDNFLMGWVYTMVSLLRSYMIRRVFNGRQISVVIAEKTGRTYAKVVAFLRSPAC